MQDRERSGRPSGGGARGGAGRPPGRRPISPRSPLEGRQLWRIGDWGGASEQIGRQWERLGARALEGLIGVERLGPDGAPYLPVRAIVLQAEPELAAQVQANGKTHADAILVGAQGERSILEPVDFKWTLETANPRQVGAEVLAELLNEPPPLLATRLGEALAGTPSPEQPVYHDGIFLAPDHAENRAQLAPQGPLDAEWAVLCQVDATEFFSPLIGWDVALAMARSDSAFLGTVESSERYYRLGAGVLGAIRRLSSSVFDEALPEVDGPARLAVLRRDRRLTTTGEVIAYFDRALTARSEVVDRLKDVERGAYPYGRFREDLAARGVTVAGNQDRRWSRVYGSIMKVLAAELRAQGRELRVPHRTDLDVLALLEAGKAGWLARGRAMLDERLASRPDPEPPAEQPPGEQPPASDAATD
ncbi:MAG: hypothetical protein IT306_15400 [Chloroflexi bacterium]|nr:hypothetical protein [Chloroflexota bacterium]